MDSKGHAFICLINGTSWPNVMFLNQSSMIIMSDKGAVTLKIISEVNSNACVLVLMMKITEMLTIHHPAIIFRFYKTDFSPSN